MTARKAARQPVPTLLDEYPEWREYVDKETGLADRHRAARDAEREEDERHRAALRAYDRELSAAALGEIDPPGERPARDVVPQTVAFRARERLNAHRATRNRLLADLADRVESAARAWWESESPTVTGHVREITDDADRLTAVLAQVRDVRSAVDREAARHGTRPTAPLADRTARTVDVATLTALGDADPFKPADPVPLRGRIMRDSTSPPHLGVQRYDVPGPDGREPGPSAVPTTGTNPGRDFL